MTPTPWLRVLGTVVGLVGLLALLLSAFAWPAARSDLHGIPLVVAGPPGGQGQAVEQVRAALEQARPGAFEITAVADEAAARRALTGRDAYGAIVVTEQGPRVLTASAASPVVAQALGQLAQRLAMSESGTRLAPPTDVVPVAAADPRGAALAAGALPLAIGGLAVASALSLAVAGRGRRVLAGILVATLAGPALAGILHGWLGALSGDYWLEAAAIGGGLLAGTLGVLGLAELLGRPGIGLGALLLVLLGNPLSAAASAPEMLPQGWGSFGQALPPGAVVSLLRSVSFFDGNGAVGPVLVLTAWVLGGLLLVGLAGLLRRPAGPGAAADDSRSLELAQG